MKYLGGIIGREPKMPLLTELENPLLIGFYKYATPAALTGLQTS
jgi:hypothetical protein